MTNWVQTFTCSYFMYDVGIHQVYCWSLIDNGWPVPLKSRIPFFCDLSKDFETWLFSVIDSLVAVIICGVSVLSLHAPSVNSCRWSSRAYGARSRSRLARKTVILCISFLNRSLFHVDSRTDLKWTLNECIRRHIHRLVGLRKTAPWSELIWIRAPWAWPWMGQYNPEYVSKWPKHLQNNTKCL